MPVSSGRVKSQQQRQSPVICDTVQLYIVSIKHVYMAMPVAFLSLRLNKWTPLRVVGHNRSAEVSCSGPYLLDSSCVSHRYPSTTLVRRKSGMFPSIYTVPIIPISSGEPSALLPSSPDLSISSSGTLGSTNSNRKYCVTLCLWTAN